MGYIKHNAIIVVGGKEEVTKAHLKAKKIFSSHKIEQPMAVSAILTCRGNCYYSFFVPPDGSKEGWLRSQAGDELREKFLKAIQKIDVDVVHVRFGGDDHERKIIEGYGDDEYTW